MDEFLGLDRDVTFRDLYIAMGVFALLVYLDRLGHKIFTTLARAKLDES